MEGEREEKERGGEATSEVTPGIITLFGGGGGSREERSRNRMRKNGASKKGALAKKKNLGSWGRLRDAVERGESLMVERKR